MPNAIGPLGLTIATQAELLANLTSLLQKIYGVDINLASDTPDGQWINDGIIQPQLDMEDLLAQINANFDPDQAIGVFLDQRVAINGIQRQGGTFTQTNVTLVTSQSVNLYGLDQSVQPVYTVSDNAGNLWQLIATQLAVSIGTNVFAFQAALPGAILTTPNTITIQATIVLGVVSVNNPTTYTTLGTNQESDANLRLRRQQSVSNSSQGYLKGLLGNLENLTGVTSAFVYENDTATTDADGVPGHSIWVIISGTASAQSIATVIYQQRNAGCGMFGQTNFTLMQVNGTTFTVYWDMVVPQNLFIRFTASSINGIDQPNLSGILAGLPVNYVPGVFQEVNINGLATQVQDIDPNTLVTNAGFSTGQTQILTLSAVAASGAFVLNYNGNSSSSINWNDSVATIQSKTRAITGLSTAVVTGSIASESLSFNLTSIDNIQGLLYVTSNTLMSSVPAAITFSYNEGYSNTLTPSKKNFQFVVSSLDTVILPMILTPQNPSVATLGSLTFIGLGGYHPLTYSLSVNNSGGSIDSSTGAYTAGSTGSVSDTVRVVDVFGNAATSVVSVT